MALASRAGMALASCAGMALAPGAGTRAPAPRAGERAPASRAGKRVMVLFEAGHAGVAAVRVARELAEHGGVTVTAVGFAPQAPTLRGCGPSAAGYNEAVRAAVGHELGQAEELLWPIGSRASCRLLVEGSDPSLEQFAARERFDLILLPAHRRPLRSAKHPAAAALRRTGAEVRIVSARAPRIS